VARAPGSLPGLAWRTWYLAVGERPRDNPGRGGLFPKKDPLFGNKRYWPAVEAELRKMEYSKKSPQGGSRMASIDMSKMDVEGLKSAGFPLVMSFSDDQRRELKSLAHLLGLESVMAGL